MKGENVKALLDTIEAFKQNPTCESEMKVAMLISIATSLALIADCMTEANDIKERSDTE